MTFKTTPDQISSTEPAVYSYITKVIPFLAGRPIRDTIITSDDIVNLIIACNTCTSIEEFFSIT